MATGSQFEGWKNFETWSVNQWLTDEESDYDSLMVLVNDPELDRQQKAETLKTLVGEMNPLVDHPSLWGDLMGAALQSVDWMEIILNPQEE